MAEEVEAKTAVNLARMEGKLDQSLSDHGRRLSDLEAWRASSGQRFFQYLGPLVAVAALLVTVMVSLPR
jgi:hypothetical protein